jgi:flagellar biosynthesis/type III secretory pathway protein FliH
MSIAEELMERGRREAMTMAEELIQKARQEGWQEGWREGLSLGKLVGSIRTLQEWLNLPVSQRSELEHQPHAALEQLLLSLKVQSRSN